MTTEPGKEERSILIRGADGAMYYIPDSALEAFRMPDDQAAEVQDALDSDTGGYVDQGLGPAVNPQSLLLRGAAQPTIIIANFQDPNQ